LVARRQAPHGLPCRGLGEQLGCRWGTVCGGGRAARLLAVTGHRWSRGQLSCSNAAIRGGSRAAELLEVTGHRWSRGSRAARRRPFAVLPGQRSSGVEPISVLLGQVSCPRSRPRGPAGAAELPVMVSVGLDCLVAESTGTMGPARPVRSLMLERTVLGALRDEPRNCWPARAKWTTRSPCSRPRWRRPPVIPDCSTVAASFCSTSASLPRPRETFARPSRAVPRMGFCSSSSGMPSTCRGRFPRPRPFRHRDPPGLVCSSRRPRSRSSRCATRRVRAGALALQEWTRSGRLRYRGAHGAIDFTGIASSLPVGSGREPRP
jgi:hypothetical protein